MRIRFRAIAALLLCGASRTARGQSPCLPADSTSATVISALTSLVTSTEPSEVSMRNSLGFSEVSSSQLSLVVTGTECTNAREAVDLLFNTPNSNRRMHVVKAGSKRFVVKDQNGEALFVFDNKWAHVQTVSPG